MKKTPVDHNGEQENVFSLQFDAGFYFERAIRSLERHRYDQALKYFRLSIEKEPENPVSHCNLAGLLSELGEFEESNRILETVRERIDPDLHECLFFMANNYAHLEHFEMAETCLLEYVHYEPEGKYVEEAEEMLYLISYELGRPPRELMLPLPVYMQKHEDARLYLEEGEFSKAILLLEEIIEMEPTFLAAYNNLSLAYFYRGQMDAAMKMIEYVLAEEPANLHALCNLAMLAYQAEQFDLSHHLTKQLKKLIPLQQDHSYKLATTLGILGEHEAAYQLFRKLVKSGMEPDSSLYHCLAVAACNSGRRLTAKHYWKQAASLDLQSPVPLFYLSQLHEWSDQPNETIPAVPYHYHLPFEEKLLQLQLEQQDPEAFSHEPLDQLLRASLRWVLDSHDPSAKIKVIQLLGMIGDQESESLLKAYLLRRIDETECKKLALLVLHQMKAELPYTVWINNQLHKIDLEDEEHSAQVNEVWNQVLLRCLEGMKHYSSHQQDDVKRLWTAFIEKQGTSLPTVRRVDAWAAAFEYVIAKYHGLHITQSQVATKYAVSPSTVSHHVKKLHPVQRVFSK